MAYKAATIQNLKAGETGYQLASGDYIAASARAGANCDPSHVAVTIRCRWVDVQGAPQLDHGGKPVEWEFTHSALQTGIATGTVTGPQLLQEAIDLCAQGFVGATPPADGSLRADGGINARIAAVKTMKAAMGS